MSIITACSSSTFESIASVGSLKSLLSITSTVDDVLMEDILIRATSTVESHLGWPIRKRTYIEQIASYGSMFLQVTNTPVQSISRILKDGFLISSTEYELASAEAGSIYRAFGWAWTAGVVTDLVSHAVPGTERLSFAVEYQGGYVPISSTSTQLGVPAGLEQATLEIGKAWYLGRKRNPQITQRRVGDLSITYGGASRDAQGSMQGIPPSALAILNSYQRLV